MSTYLLDKLSRKKRRKRRKMSALRNSIRLTDIAKVQRRLRKKKL